MTIPTEFILVCAFFCRLVCFSSLGFLFSGSQWHLRISHHFNNALHSLALLSKNVFCMCFSGIRSDFFALLFASKKGMSGTFAWASSRSTFERIGTTIDRAHNIVESAVLSLPHNHSQCKIFQTHTHMTLLSHADLATSFFPLAHTLSLEIQRCSKNARSHESKMWK